MILTTPSTLVTSHLADILQAIVFDVNDTGKYTCGLNTYNLPMFDLRKFVFQECGVLFDYKTMALAAGEMSLVADQSHEISTVCISSTHPMEEFFFHLLTSFLIATGCSDCYHIDPDKLLEFIETLRSPRWNDELLDKVLRYLLEAGAAYPCLPKRAYKERRELEMRARQLLVDLYRANKGTRNQLFYNKVMTRLTELAAADPDHSVSFFAYRVPNIASTLLPELDTSGLIYLRLSEAMERRERKEA